MNVTRLPQRPFACEQERVICRVCHASTHEHQYVQYFFNVMATGMGAEEYRLSGRPLGKLLWALENENRKSCDYEKGIVHFALRDTLLSLVQQLLEPTSKQAL